MFLAVLGAVWPKLMAWPLAAICLWLGLALLYRAAKEPHPERVDTPRDS